MDQDHWVSDFFTAGPRILRSGPQLALIHGATQITLSSAADASPAVPLQGTTWTLETVSTGLGPDGVSSSVPPGLTSTGKSWSR